MFAYELRRRRTALGLTQAELARALGVDRNTLARWERNELSVRHRDLVDGALRRLEADHGLATNSSERTDSPPHNLPPELTSFIGREQELSDLKYALRTTRLLTLTGVGGTGKTRLALRLAREVWWDYRDGVWFVDLAPIAEQGLVCQTVAGVFGLQDRTGQPPTARLGAALRQRHTLVILDNCEHVLEAVAELAARLLRAAPHVRILSTSREPLGITGETSRAVSPLPVPNLSDYVTWNRLLEYPSARLLIERAAARSAYSAQPENVKAIAEICGRLSGLPLSLELAAARLPVLRSSSAGPTP